MSLLKKLKRQRFPLILSAVVLAIVFSTTLPSSFGGQPFNSVEVAIAEHSPNGPVGGAVVPASCPSYAHDPGGCPICTGSTQVFGQTTQLVCDGNGNCANTPVDTCNSCPAGTVANADHTQCITAPPSCSTVGQPCSSSNACGTLTGTIQANCTCSVTAPALPTNYGNSCTSGANSCGQTNTGTIGCTNTCSATTPSNSSCTSACGGNPPVGYGNSCTSGANSCGMTNTGTIQCSGACSATPPPNSSCPLICGGSPPVGYGNTCTSAANYCGNTNTGTIQCSGACSAVTPPSSTCVSTDVPTVSLTANATRVRPNGVAVLTWWAHSVTNCSLVGPGTTDSATANAAGDVPIRNKNSAPITGQSTYVLTCQTSGDDVTASITINIIPNQVEI